MDQTTEQHLTSRLETRGLRVDHRPRSVDCLENVISLGNLAPILRKTLDAALLGPGQRLVDVGCGSGRLAVAAARGNSTSAPSEVLGIDATPAMISLARKRAEREGSRAIFRVGVAEALPLPDQGTDAVTSSFLLHHLPPDVKPQALREMWRVLKPGGRLVVTDYATPRNLLGVITSAPMRLNFYEYVRPQLKGEIEQIIERERMGPLEVVGVFIGYITVFRAIKPSFNERRRMKAPPFISPEGRR
jgi:ubiquinone/menaquinone biosynthesis C-methylase UbiE